MCPERTSHSYPTDGATRGSHDPNHRRGSAAAQGIRAVSCSTRSLRWTLLRWAAAASCSVIGGMSPIKRCPAPFAIATSLFAPVAHANDALEAKVRPYVPVVSLAKVIRINDAASGEHRAMLEAVKSDPNASKLAYRVHYETQTAYIKARDGGQRVVFCKDFIAANSQDAKARFTAVVEDHMSDVSTSAQKAITHNLCGAPPSSCRGPTGKRTHSSKRCFRASKSWPRKTPRRTVGTSPRKRQRSRNSSARRCGDRNGIGPPVAVPRMPPFRRKTTYTCPRARAHFWCLGVPAI